MKKLRTEPEIIASWQEDIDQPIVSVCCTAFNHESYIEDALEGFLIQETEFPFEIIIHDDASTDNTADIIRKYEEKYPRLIKAIYQTENQYSKGLKIGPQLIFPRARGAYLALCEGDDFWTCRNKLERQVSFLRQNPEVSLSIHRAYISIDNEVTKLSISHGKPETVLPSKLIYTTAGQFCPTASMVIAREKVEVMPKFFNRVPVGDFFLQAITGVGGVHYLPDACSVYRLGSNGSWTNRVLGNDKKYFEKSKKMLTSLKELKEYLETPDSNYVQHKVNIIHLNLANVHLKNGNFKKSRENWFSSIRNFRRPQKTDIRLFLGLLKVRF